MNKFVRPSRVYDFTSASIRMQPLPGDRLDSQLQNHADAIVAVQQAIEGLSGPITADRVHAKFKEELAQGVELRVRALLEGAGHAALRADQAAETARVFSLEAVSTASRVEVEASRAESAAREYREAKRAFLEAYEEKKREFLEIALSLSQGAGREATEPVGLMGANAGGRFANFTGDRSGGTAVAADFADVSIAWAEWMGDGSGSDVIPTSILAINAISGDHWSARWWAHRAAGLFGGQFAYYYLGPYPAPPLETPDGQPIPPGALYYNTSLSVMYVWSGTTWQTFGVPSKAATFSLYYTVASAGQTVFNTGTTDGLGSSHVLNPDGSEGIEVYFNGVRLTPTQDYTVNAAASTVTLAHGAGIGSVVAIDVLTPRGQLAPGLVNCAKLTAWTFNGTTTTFALNQPGVGARTASSASQLLVALDGVEQEPGVDFTIDVGGTNIVFVAAPSADAKSFCVMLG